MDHEPGDVADVDPLDLVVEARARRKSWGELSRLVAESVPLVWRAGPRLFIALLALQIVGALALAGQVLAVQAVLGAVLELDDGAAPRRLWFPVLAFAALTATASVAGAVRLQVQRLLGERVTRATWGDVLDVATRVSLRHFESPGFHDRLDRVQTNALTRPYQVSDGVFTIAGALAAGLGLGVALMTIHPALLPLVVLGGAPLFVTSQRESRLEFDFAVRQTPVLRLIDYLVTVQTGRREAGEVRAFSSARWLRDRFEQSYTDYLAALRRHLRRRAVLSVVGSVTSAAILLATMVVLLRLLSAGQLTVEGAGAAILAIRLLAGQVQAVFSGVQRLFEAGLFLDDLAEFTRLGSTDPADRPLAPAPPAFRTITADDVTFTYPGSDVPVLRGVSVELRAGEVVALVGENGSGKSTLATILAGLHEPDTGSVRWDGVDTRTFDPAALRMRVAVVFQDFVRYAFTAEENIALGPLDEAARRRVRAAAAAAGAELDLSGLPSGYETVLSRLFSGGRDLSGGQWQRVAIARAFYRHAPLLILDEPSAALDPRAEHALFAGVRRSLRGRTALVISHRLTTVREADRIYLLDAGTVVERGTHSELLALGGRYAELFRLQAEAYVAQDRGPAPRSR